MTKKKNQTSRAQRRRPAKIFLVMGSRDTTDFDESSEEYPICFYYTNRQAIQHTALATSHVRKISPDPLRGPSALNGLCGDEYKSAREQLRRENILDPHWTPEKATTYSVLSVSNGAYPTVGSKTKSR